MDKKEFIFWEKASKDTIDVKRVYIDIAGDIKGGIILSQIIYWHLPSNNGEKSRLRVHKKGYEKNEAGFWLAKSYKDWYEECRVKEDSARRRIKKLEQNGIIETHIWRFNNIPTTHIRIVWDKFLSELENSLNQQEVKSEAEDNSEDRNLHTTKQAISINPQPQFADIEPSNLPGSLTKTTTENTTDNTSKIKDSYEVEEIKSISPTSLASKSIKDSRENKISDYPTAKAEGHADGTAALSTDRLAESDTEKYGAKVRKKREE